MNAYSHSHTNELTKQKTYSKIISNLIYIFINLSQLLTFIKIIYFSC